MKITIGKTQEGKNVGFDLDELITTRLLIQANSGAGKSYLLRKLMEQLFGHIQVIAIDPEGEFATLREKYGFVLVGKGGETPADPRIAADVAEKLLEIRASAVCDIYELKPAERHRWVRLFLEAMVNAPKKLWHPVMVIVDEAHIFCPQSGAGESEAKEAMIDLTTRGRKRGFCAVWATQRLAKVDKDATSMLLNRLVGGTFEDVDIKRALDLLSIVPEEKHAITQQLKTIDPGYFYAFGRAIAKERVLFRVGEVETSHPKPGSAKHASEPPPAPDQVKDLLPKLADLPKAAEEKARTMLDLQQQLRATRAELAAAKRERPAEPKESKVDGRAVFSQMVEAVSVAIQRRDDEWVRSVGEYQIGVGKLLDGIRFKAPKSARILLPDRPVPQPAAPPPTPKSDTPKSHTAKSYTAAESNGDLSRPQMRILQALAEFESIGRSQAPKKWIAAFAGVSHSSGSFGNNLGALRTAGHISYPAAGEVALTDSGRAVAPEIQPPTTSEEMLDRCKQIMSGPQGRVLDELFHAYPQSLEKAVVAERTGVSASSGSFGNNLGALRSAGMIEYPEAGKARAADWLFLE